MTLQLQQELKAEGVTVSLVKLCQWFEMPRRTVYYRPTKGAAKVQEKFVTPIKAMIEENPAFGYRTVAHLLGMNKNTVQRVFQSRVSKLQHPHPEDRGPSYDLSIPVSLLATAARHEGQHAAVVRRLVPGDAPTADPRTCHVARRSPCL